MTLIDKRIIVTGGNGFLGSYIVANLLARGCRDVFVPAHEKYDLRRKSDVGQMYFSMRPDIVIHAAASAGGIGWNRENPAVALYDNLMMGLNLLEAAVRYKLEKFVQISSVCAYPLDVLIPTKEDYLWYGYPEPTNAAYGISKRTLSVACDAYRSQYGLNAISLMPVNLYGPRDDFHPASSHVIAAMIRKFREAGKEPVTLWGTGNVSREFLYVKDCAEAVVLATKEYNGSMPVNIGSGKETYIRNLALMVSKATGHGGQILWDESKPDGQPRRLFDSSRAYSHFGFKASTGLAEGLEKTVEWYRENYEKVQKD